MPPSRSPAAASPRSMPSLPSSRTTSPTRAHPAMRPRPPPSRASRRAAWDMGVRSAPAQRDVDQALQTEVLQQNATTAGLTTTSAALTALDAVQGTPGQGQDLGEPSRQRRGCVLDASERPEQRHATGKRGVFRQHIGKRHQHAQQRLHDAAPGRAERHRQRGRHDQRRSRDHRRPVEPDHRRQGGGTEHRRSGEPSATPPSPTSRNWSA